MAQSDTRHSFVPDTSSKLQEKVCTASSVKSRIAVLEVNLSSAANTISSSHTPKPNFDRRCTDSSGPASHLKNVAVKSAVKANPDISSNSSVSPASAKPTWNNNNRHKPITALQPETQKFNVPSQSTRPSLPQKNSITKQQSLTDSDGRVENIICTKPPQLPKYIRTNDCGTQNQLQRESAEPSVPMKRVPDAFAVGSPPPKPDRPPSVDIQRFRRNTKSLTDGSGMKILRRAKPAPAPPRLRPPSNHAAVLMEPAERSDKHKESEVTEGKQAIKGPAHVIKKRKALLDFKRVTSNVSLNQGGRVHSTVVPMKSESFDTDHDVSNEDEEPMSMSNQSDSEIYDDIGAPDDRREVSGVVYVPGNMAASFRGRPIRSLRMRGRNDSGEENVPLDLTREPSENFREILQNVAKPHGVSNMRKLGHLNNFIKLCVAAVMMEDRLSLPRNAVPTSIATSNWGWHWDGLQERPMVRVAAIAYSLKTQEVVAKTRRPQHILKSVTDRQPSRINGTDHHHLAPTQPPTHSPVSGALTPKWETLPGSRTPGDSLTGLLLRPKSSYPIARFLEDTEEALMMNLRDRHILNHKHNLEWNWLLIATILKWPNVNLRNNKDEQMHKRGVGVLSSWGMELRRAHFTHSKAVSMEALDIPDELRGQGQPSCSNQLKPALSHLGDKGSLLLLRFRPFLKGNDCSSNWGLNLQEENVIPDILTLAQHCEVLSVRGTCVYVLGVISKTRQGCEVLKQYGWDAVRHSRRTSWPVTPDEVDTQLTSELSSVPSTLSLNSESTSSRHNSESESQPNMYILDDDSPFTILASSRCVRTRFLNSLSLPSKKLRSTSDPKTPSGSRTPTDLKTGSMRRNRTVTEPSVYSPNQGDVFTPVFNGRGMPKSPTVSLETSFVGTRGGSEEHLVDGRLARGGGSGLGLSGLAGHGTMEHPSREREQSSRERLAGDGGSSSSGGNVGGGGGGGGGTQFKSRSQSFNTDTTTSGISSMSSSPSRETVGNPEHPEPEPDSSDCVSLNTVVSAKTVKTLPSLTPQAQTNHMSTPKSSTVSLVPPGSSHTLPRRAQSLKSPSVTTIKSLADCSFIYTSPRDALGYATLKRLQQQRIHPSLSHSEALASPAKDVLFTDTITMKTGSLDSRLTPRRFLKALSFASLDKEELLSPINQSTLQRCSSVRSMVSSATFGCNDDYIGLALPMDINDMFHIRDSAYFQQRISPPSEERKRFLFGDGDGDRPAIPVLKQQFSISELIVCRGDTQNHTVGSEETGLQDHTEENCLYCVGAIVLGYPTQPQINSTHPRTDYVDFPSWGGQSGHRLEVMPQSKFSGVSGCSDAAVSQGSICSTPTPGDIVIGGKAISEDGPASRVLLRKEVLRLIINLSSSVGTKGHETGLLTIKEKFPYAFDDICLYSEVSHLLAHCMFRLTSRRFIQELFQDVQFMPMYEEAEAILTKLPKPVEEDVDPPTES
ncbi:rapamycin-insensitive companion of mTOR isoform X2 [Lates japonicus]|uniref:Rapamycin-insensitive companion of mTOR isoform X2 n=1 Tax=Lates japonicus TaxID=270547 RepID=A0AAD3R266_LATJO|nr:rapamycin-insensitive companion of mTOR isoform X2 [Lates japonicus]